MATTFTITTWNVQNLFKPAANDDEAQALYDQKIPLLAKTIRGLDPDVLGLQEVGGDDALADLQKALGNYPHRHFGTPDSRGIACALLSKHPIDVHNDVLDFPKPVLEMGLVELDGKPMTRMGRGVPHVTVKAPGFRTNVMVVHLKSKLLSFPGNVFTTKDETLRARVASLALLRRTAEAATVRMAANTVIATNDKRALVVLGDFNDGPLAATTQLFQGPDGSEIDTRGFDPPDDGDSARLWNLAPRIAEDRRFSRIHRGQGELLDQIFTSEEYFPRGDDGLRRMPVSVDSLVDEIRSIGDNAAAASKRIRPDHSPVSAVFEFE